MEITLGIPSTYGIVEVPQNPKNEQNTYTWLLASVGREGFLGRRCSGSMFSFVVASSLDTVGSGQDKGGHSKSVRTVPPGTCMHLRQTRQTMSAQVMMVLSPRETDRGPVQRVMDCGG